MHIRHAEQEAVRIYTAADITWFKVKIQDWLHEAGFGYCGLPGHVGPRVLNYRLSRQNRRCKACAVRRQNEWKAIPENQVKRDAYWKSERGREVLRRAQAKYQAKKALRAGVCEDHAATY